MQTWARVGHHLAPRAWVLFDDGDGFLVIDVPGDPRLYLQWHGEPDGDFYAEAASGLYDEHEDALCSSAQVECLRLLGWTAPGEGACPSVKNWSIYWHAPVVLYAVVHLTVRTLREVFHADPHRLLEAL